MEPPILGFDGTTVETSSFGFDEMDFGMGIFDDAEVASPSTPTREESGMGIFDAEVASPSTPTREESAKLFRGHINGLPVHLLEHGPSVVEVTEEDYLALKVYRRRGPRTATTHSQITASMSHAEAAAMESAAEAEAATQWPDWAKRQAQGPQHFPLYDEALVRGRPGSVLSPRARSLRVLRWRTKRLGQKRGARKRKTGSVAADADDRISAQAAKIAKTVMPVLVQMPMVSTEQMPLSPFTDQEASDEDIALRT